MNLSTKMSSWLLLLVMGLMISQGTVFAQDKAISGSVSIANSYVAGESTILDCNLTYTSPDAEWADDLTLTFPAGFTITAASTINGKNPVINGQSIFWDVQYVSSNVNADFTVTVTTDAGLTGTQTVSYVCNGDGWGGAPHFFDGTTTVTQAVPKLDVNPVALDLGEWPIGGWQENEYLELINAGIGDVAVTASELDDPDGVFALTNPTIPTTITEGNSIMVGVAFDSETAVDGPYTATYVAAWGAGKSVTTSDIMAMAYTAPVGDIVENPFMVTLPYAGIGETTAMPMRTNYNLPGTATNGKDVVYMFTLTEDKELNVAITNSTETPKMAIYAAGFEGEGGPMVMNAAVAGGADITAAPLFAGDYYLVVSCEADDAANTFDLNIDATTMPDPECAMNEYPADGDIDIASNGLTLTWEYGMYVQEYQVMFGTTYPPTTELVPWTTAVGAGGSADLPNLDPSMQYFWQVNVRNNNATVTCDVWGFTTTLTPPSDLTATVVMVGDDENDYNVELNWTSSAKALLGYNVYRDGTMINSSLVIETNYTDLSVPYNMNPCYEYQVEAIFDEGISAMSNVATACVTGTGMVDGFVYELLTGNPIAGALVEVGGYSIETDLVGYYSIEVLEDTYDYSVSMDGYITEHLTDIDVAYNTTVSTDFYLDEFPYPVNSVVATELDENTVQVDWGGNGGGSIAEWLFYDDGTNVDGIGGPASFSWAIKFDADQLVDFPGSSITKIQIYARTTAPITLNILQGDNGETNIYSETLTGLPVEVWSEVDLAAAAAFDNTQALWISCYTDAGGAYPAGCGATVNNPNSDLITLDGSTWEHLSDYGLPYSWNLRAFVTDAAGKSFRMTETSTPEYAKIPNYDIKAANIAPPTATATIPTVADVASKDLMGYNVYRQVCNEETPMEFLGMTLDNQFTDNTWGAVTWGTYKWAVEVIYTNNVSEVAYSNCLDKDMIATVNVEVSTNSGDTPEGCEILFTNLSEPDLELTYELELDETGLGMIEEFRKGTYDIQVSLAGYEVITEEDILIDMDMTFVWQLIEMLTPPDNLYVTPTGFATWTGGGVAPFEPLVEDFEGGELPEGWTMTTNSAQGWFFTTNGSSSWWDIPAGDGYYACANDDAANDDGSMDYLITPMLDFTGNAEPFLTFSSYFTAAYGQSAHIEVSLDGTTWTNVMDVADASSWSDITVDLAAYAGEGEVWIAFHSNDNGSWASGWAFDNVMVTDGMGKTAKAFQFFKVNHDGVFSTDTDTTFYQYGDMGEVLVPGETYMASVASLYSTGLSELSFYEWTYLPCDSFAGPMMDAYNVEGTDDVVVLWGEPGSGAGGELIEDFEGGVTPEGWEVIVTNSTASGPAPAHWTVNEYASADFGPIDTYHAGLWWDYGHQDEWLITPEIPCGAATVLDFSTAVYEGSTYGDHYYVKVSTDDGATWTEVWDASALTGNAWNYYSTPYSIDLSAFAGETIKIAFNAVDGDGQGLWYVWFIDNLAVTSSKGAFSFKGSELTYSGVNHNGSTKSNASHSKDGNSYPVLATKAAKADAVVIGTNVYREGEMIAFVPAPDTFYLDNNLEPGYYDYCVAAVYSEDEGEHTWTSCIDANCEEDVLIPEECLAPEDLEAIDEAGNGPVVILNWGAASGFDPIWLQYDDGTNVDGIGGPAEFTYAAKWDPSQLADYDGSAVTKVNFFPREAGTAFTLKVWKGANAGTLVHEQPLSGLTFDDWNEVELSTPVEVDISEELWVGFYVVTGGYPAGCGNFTGNPNSDLITLDGATWEHLADYGLPYSWNLAVYLDAAKGDVIELPTLVDHATYSGNATVTNGNLPISPNATLELERALTGYNVYRDGEQVNEELVLETTYTDVLPHETATYCWEVTAVYSVCGESDPSNEVCLDVFVGLNDLENNVAVYPNPATDFVMVEASSDIRSIEITNYMGQVVSSVKSVEMTQTRINTSDLSAGIYFVEVETAAGIEKVRIVISE